MHKNPFWIAFFSFVLLLSVWFAGKAGYSLFAYYRLSEITEATLIEATVQEKGKNHFQIEATFSFPWEGRQVVAQSSLGPSYPNRFAAEKALSGNIKKTYPTFFSKKYPEKAVLEKKFPVKRILSATTLCAVAIYFLILGLYVGKRSAPS